MFYGVIIAFGAVLYLIWKFVFAKNLQPTLKAASTLQNEPSIEHNKDIIDSKTGSQNVVVEKESYQQVEIKSIENKNNNVSNVTTYKDLQSDIVKSISTEEVITKNVEDTNIITPSLLLKQRNQNNHDKSFKRQSPPKERFAEFLEKTVLNDDKLQSIIQNLSLNECSLIKPIDDAEIEPSKQESPISEKAIRLQESIDEIGDRLKNIDAIITESVTENKTDVNKTDDTTTVKPLLLKRLEKQTGLPGGLNFGSVIGELRLKTKNASNGNLKPVFKKFDIDTVDNTEARLLFINIFLTSLHIITYFTFHIVLYNI